MNAYYSLTNAQSSSSKSGFSTVNPLRFHPHQPNLVAAGFSTTLSIIDISSYKNDSNSSLSSSTKTLTTNRDISSIDWSGDGLYLVAASEDTICVWETSHWKMITQHNTQNKLTSCVFLSSATAPSGSSDKSMRIAFGEYEAISVWQFLGGNPTRVSAPMGTVTALACGTRSDGSGKLFLASTSSSKDNNLKIWHVV
ncbi:hypothetical protein BC936DRAFT_150129 [Jimgerdemannia flammicorona]|uniref:WD40-repeat-containing domain protein n=1 Tax=Jimgerdemannia flammicorona TaxID=994334 RepID=A0A433CZG1_9FUNG|nr:hypothetical protein BC936DRAFT_150129 [Jimgerdemannia flammicorona]